MNAVELLLVVGDIADQWIQETEAAQKTFRARRTKSRVLLLAAALALLTVTVLAIRFSWHKKLLEHLSPSDAQIEELEGAVAYPLTEEKQEKMSVRICQTLTDAYGLYVVYELTVPPEIQWNERMCWRTAILTGPGEGLAPATTRTVFLGQEGAVVTLLVSQQRDAPIQSGNLTLTLQDLCRFDQTRESPYVPLVKGTWELSWEFEYVDVGQRYHAGNAGVYLSPMTLCVTWPEEMEQMEAPVLHFRDGSTRTCGDETSDATRIHRAGQTVCIYRFVPMLELSEVEIIELAEGKFAIEKSGR